MSTLIVNTVQTISGATLDLSASVNVTGALSVLGNTTLGNASSDTLVFNASTLSIPNNLGATGGNIYVGSATMTSQAGVARFLGISHASSAGVVLNDTGGKEYAIYTADNKLYTTAGAVQLTTLTTAAELGINTNSPAKQVEINSATGDNLRLTYNDSNGGATNYADFSVSSGGDLTINASGGDLTLSDNVIISGDLTVNGTTTTVNSATITVDDPNIELNSVASPTDANANGGGITLKGTSDYKIEWLNATDKWTLNQGLHVDGGSLTSYFDGKLGVGETTPLGKLHVKSGDSPVASISALGDELVIENSTNAGISILAGDTHVAGIYFPGKSQADTVDDDNGAIKYDNSTDDLIFKTNGSESLHIKSSGNVGIGTGSPSAKLHVAGTMEVDSNLTVDGDLTINGGDITIADTANIKDASGHVRVTFTDTGDTQFNDEAGNAVMYIDTAQRVGIGTATPAVDLEISNDHPKLRFQTKDAGGDCNIDFKSLDGSSLALIRCQAAGNALDHLSIGAGSSEDDFVLDSNGKIGIGEQTPLGQLHVKTEDSGITTVDTKADELVVESNGNAGISILGGPIHVVGLYFPTSSDPDESYIKYDHGANTMTVRTNGTDAVQIDSSGHLIPASNDTFNLGSSSNRWKNIFTMDLHLANDRGDWTVIEEEDYLSLRNNKNGKLFKILMQEISEE